MPIPTGGRIIHIDFSNPACFNGSGTAVTDLSGSGNNFTLDNTNYTFSTSYGGELLIDNSNRLGKFTNITGYGYGTDAISINLWMQQTNFGIADFQMFYILSETGGTGTRNTIYFGSKPGTPGNEFYLADGTNTALSNYDFPLNTWKMVTCVKPAGAHSGSMLIYINGVPLPMSWSGTGLMNIVSGFPTFIANPSPASGFWNFDALIGEVSIYNTELSPTDVTDYFDATAARYGLAPPPYVGSVGGRQFGQGFNG